MQTTCLSKGEHHCHFCILTLTWIKSETFKVALKPEAKYCKHLRRPHQRRRELQKKLGCLMALWCIICGFYRM